MFVKNKYALLKWMAIINLQEFNGVYKQNVYLFIFMEFGIYVNQSRQKRVRKKGSKYLSIGNALYNKT